MEKHRVLGYDQSKGAYQLYCPDLKGMTTGDSKGKNIRCHFCNAEVPK